MDEQPTITCAKCGSTPDDVLILTCDHNLCLKCASRKLKSNSEKSKNTSYKSITCEFCNTDTVLDPASAADLLAMNSIDEYPVQNENRKPQASNYRAKMEETLPEKSEDKHQITTSVKPLEVQQNNSSSISSFCPNHPEEEIKYFCFDCLVPPLCSECVINGVHKTHKVQNIKKSLPTVQGYLREFLQSLDSRASQLNALIQSFHTKLKEEDEQNKIYKNQVKSIFDELRHKLIQKEKEMFQYADDSVNEGSQDLINYERQISNKLQNIQANSNVISSQISEKNPLELLSFYSENYNLIIQLLEIDKKDKRDSYPEAKAIINPDILRDLKSKSSEIGIGINKINMEIYNTRENPYQSQNKRISNQKLKNDRFGL